MHHRTGFRRGDVDDAIVVILVVFFIVVAGLIIGFSNWHIGYRHGQIDAANGVMKFTKVEQDDTTYWYKTDKPKNLYIE